MHIAIIGGGAAGMMAAARLAETSDHKISLWEKNRQLGTKVRISGGGRCNLTTGIYRSKDLVKHYTRGADIAREVFTSFGPKKVRQRFEDHGVRTKEESDKRVFPISNDGNEVVGTFEKLLREQGVDIYMGEGVDAIQRDTEGFIITTKGGAYQADKVVIATGGNAYSHTGSTGDGYAFARGLGHTVTPLGPSLNSFITTDKALHKLSGIAFEKASVHRENRIFSAPVLLTHFGISGPLAFIVASHSAFENIDQTHPLRIRLQFHADRDQVRWERYLIDMGSQSPRKTLKNIIKTQYPSRVVDYFFQKSQINPNQVIGTLSKQHRTAMTDLLGNGVPLTIVGRKPGDEFVTAGGVTLDEIDHKTLESRLVSGLYFAGEVLNVDGVTGGFNLQWCWASGYRVAENIIR